MSTEQNPPSSITLVLASQSARRLELLQQVGIEPLCLPVDADETPLNDESAKALVERLARLKATTCAQQLFKLKGFSNETPYVILGADTVIELDGLILGKPRDEEHAIRMLQSLSDREHQVHSGVCVHEVHTGCVRSIVVSTKVRFARLSAVTARRYWLTGEPVDKAGSYAIQGIGAQFVVHLSGSYSNVVGLPLFETIELLQHAGISYL